MSRYIPRGIYRLVVKVPGFADHTSEPIEVVDLDDVLPLIVELVPENR